MTELARRFNTETVLRQDTLLLHNPKECREGKKVCPFFLLENSRPLSPWGPLDSLSTCLGNDSHLSWNPINSSLLVHKKERERIAKFCFGEMKTQGHLTPQLPLCVLQEQKQKGLEKSVTGVVRVVEFPIPEQHGTSGGLLDTAAREPPLYWHKTSTSMETCSSRNVIKTTSVYISSNYYILSSTSIASSRWETASKRAHSCFCTTADGCNQISMDKAIKQKTPLIQSFRVSKRKCVSSTGPTSKCSDKNFMLHTQNLQLILPRLSPDLVSLSISSGIFWPESLLKQGSLQRGKLQIGNTGAKSFCLSQKSSRREGKLSSAMKSDMAIKETLYPQSTHKALLFIQGHASFISCLHHCKSHGPWHSDSKSVFVFFFNQLN